MLIGPSEEERGSAESCIPHLFLIELPCMVPKARQREVQEGSTGGAALPCAHPAQSLFRSCMPEPRTLRAPLCRSSRVSKHG